ncbi:putative isopullulanase precursor [Phaeomoniella chlamydospora]|uniref:Putative isopullulanase n=1 Tax=Phaeomoniella chlamydospora TaxID=158046 RepID=A0A0G2H332_PHACM|nr:putative isopullulanase precursor [Phaeomoniella chlamydospora]
MTSTLKTSSSSIGSTTTSSIASASSVAVNGTVNNSQLHTWWHSTGEMNTNTSVQPGNVRQSSLYSVQVSTVSGATYYNSFVYESIPRNGNGNILTPNDPSSTTTNDDGITIEVDIGMSMAWSQFLYAEDVMVKVSRLDGHQANASDITVRPTTLGYTVTAQDGDIYIHVPFSSSGTRFSVEFADNLYTFRDGSTSSEAGYVQNSVSEGYSYVESYSSVSNPAVGVEPLNSLLIFASPMETSDMIPDETDSTSYIVSEGEVSDLSSIDATTVIFKPGVYYFGATNHALLSSTVNWVYFAPGSYVKGAIEYQETDSPIIRATGHGVLSGEQYVYQANTADGYRNSKNQDYSLRMWRGVSTWGINQTWVINGPTINAPPFNTMDWTGDMPSLRVEATDYKQVGSFFGQTDGMEMYSYSTFSHIFYHSNDDTIKTYYSNVLATDLLIWKCTTAPVLQFGWQSRSLNNITVSDVNIIHSRWNSNSSNPGLIGANNAFDTSETSSANISMTVSNLSFLNWRSEGLTGPIFRIHPLQNLVNITLQSFWIAEFSPEILGIPFSKMPMLTDPDNADAEVEVSGFKVVDHMVGSTKLTEDNAAGTGLLDWAGGFEVTVE